MTNKTKKNACLQVALVEQLVDDVWSGPCAVLLNAEWSAAAVPQQYQATAASFEMLYCFMPVAVKVRDARAVAIHSTAPCKSNLNFFPLTFRNRALPINRQTDCQL